MSTIGRAIWLLGCVGCGGAPPDADPAQDDPAVDPFAWDVAAPGPYAVGFADAEVTYAIPTGEQRTVRVSVWYPTEASTGQPVRYSGVIPGGDELGDAPPAAPVHDGGHPVLAYTHGDQGYGATSADLMRYVASHGWVAVAPDHTDNLLWSNVQPTPQGHWYHRPLDVKAALDLLEDPPEGFPLAPGAADTSRVLVTGHSRGGTTVWSLAGATFDPAGQETWCPGCDAGQLALFDGGLAEPRAVAFVPMASSIRGSLFGSEGHRSVTGPVLSLTGTADSPAHAEQFDALDGIDLTWVEIEGACHQTFALGGCGTLDRDVGFHLVNTYVLAFGRRHVSGDETAGVVGLLDGTAQLDARAVWHRRLW